MALRRSAVRIRYAPGFVKQRIRVPDTLFFYAQAGQNGCRRRRPFGLTDQMVRSLASASLGGRRTRSGRSPQKASDSETRSRAHLRGINQSSFRTALHSASSLALHTIRDILTSMPTSHFHYVYIQWDASTHTHFYVGHTSDLAARLKTHNAGHVPHTSKYAPREIHTLP